MILIYGETKVLRQDTDQGAESIYCGCVLLQNWGHSSNRINLRLSDNCFVILHQTNS